MGTRMWRAEVEVTSRAGRATTVKTTTRKKTTRTRTTTRALGPWTARMVSALVRLGGVELMSDSSEDGEDEDEEDEEEQDGDDGEGGDEEAEEESDDDVVDDSEPGRVHVRLASDQQRSTRR